MYTNIPNDRENPGYNTKPRENGYRSPYDPEREWNGFSREKEREYGGNTFYQRTKREWPDREHRNATERSPSPKRRRLRDETESPPPFKDYKRNYESPRYPYRSRSRSPSPTATQTHHEPQFTHTTADKERYNSRDYTYNNRNRENDNYSRTNTNTYYPEYSQRRRTWERDNSRNKYDYRGQYSSSYRRESYDDFGNTETRRTDYDREYHRSYDSHRYDKYNNNRDNHDFERDRYKEKDQTYDNDRARNERDEKEGSRSRSRDRSDSDSEKGKSGSSANYSSNMRDDYYSPSREVEAYEQMDRKEDDRQDQDLASSGDANAPSTPTPKKRLGWGQGLVAFEKAKDPEKPEDNVQATPATPTMVPQVVQQVIHQRIEKVEVDMMAITPPMVKPEPMIEPVSQPPPSKMQIDGTIGSPSYSPEIEEVKVEKKPETPKEPLPNKEEVLLAIEKLDAEISKTEAQISLLKKPKKEHKHRHLHQNLVQDVYDENKERLSQTIEDHERLLPPNMKTMTQALYRSPRQLPVYHENIQTHAKLKSKIGVIVAKRAVEYEAKQVQIKERYQKIYENWKKKVLKLEERRQRRDQKQNKENRNQIWHWTIKAIDVPCYALYDPQLLPEVVSWEMQLEVKLNSNKLCSNYVNKIISILIVNIFKHWPRFPL